ncbi:MAG: exosortase/archaeosortase family protein [Chitinophagales bacterium]|nr:exosortase/archaeosortase family protein [Chitinophagales bacterium]
MNLLNKIGELKRSNIEYYYALCLLSVYGIWKIVKLVSAAISSLDKFGTSFNEGLANIYVQAIASLLKLFSIEYNTFLTTTSYGEFITIAIDGAPGIYVAYHCLGITASLVFALTIVLLPGSSLRKLFFITSGLATMFVMNTARLAVLVVLDKYVSRFWVEMNHSVIFVIMFYSILLLFHYLFLKPYLQKMKA